MMEWRKFYDDYDHGLWMLGAVNENGVLVDDDPAVDGLTEQQADAILGLLNAALARILALQGEIGRIYDYVESSEPGLMDAYVFQENVRSHDEATR